MNTQVLRCPLMDETIPILRLSHSRMRLARYRLPDLSACQACPAGYTPENCPLRNGFNTQVQAAIVEVLGEYQLC